jgi:hypothetical protein
VFGVVVASITAWWSLQIIRQVWAPNPPALALACRSAVRGLIDAVGRARQAAAAEMGGEQASLHAFREALGPEWKARPAVDTACAGDRDARKMLEEIDELRYAEEHAVRYEAVRLARERKRARAIAEELGALPESQK